jgi:hypothetical protein
MHGYQYDNIREVLHLHDTLTENFYYAEMERRVVPRKAARQVWGFLTVTGLAPDPFTEDNKELHFQLYSGDRLHGHKYLVLRRVDEPSMMSHGRTGEHDNSPAFEKTPFGLHRVPRKSCQ